MNKWERLSELIKENITYDAYVTNNCKKCGHKELNYWIDHKDSLVHLIMNELGLKFSSPIERIITIVSDSSTGNKKQDAGKIVQLLNEEVCSIEH